MKFLFAMLCTLGTILPADAIAAPGGSPMFTADFSSNRVVQVEYSADLVVRLGTVHLHPILIELAAGEQIDAVALGQPEAWEVFWLPGKLFVRALAGAQETTLLVTTAQRSYVFELAPTGSSSSAVRNRRAKISFVYPKAPAGKADDSPPPPLTPLEGALTQPSRNFNYQMDIVSERENIRPNQVFDDGTFTYFQFAKNQAIPAIYRSVPGAREEWLVNSHIEGSFIVLHAVAPLWILRLEGSTIGVYNEAYPATLQMSTPSTSVPQYSRAPK